MLGEMKSGNESNVLTRWLIFINERYAPPHYLPFSLFLSLGNALIACAITHTTFSIPTYGISFLVCYLFFFRLRCFDEIKDYEVDIEVNPTRPLPRGVLTLRQVKVMFVSVTLVELLLVGSLGLNALLTHVIAVVYSYLMYKEFFIGKYLSPHLTTYAVTHTFVSALLACSVFSQMTGQFAIRLPNGLLIFALATWAIFNLFEFARKTFAAEEEREHVPTYTTTFGIPGAVLLSLSQVAAAIIIVFYLYYTKQLFDRWDLLAHFIVALFPLLTGIDFIRTRSVRSVKRFRLMCSLYLLVYFGLLSYQGITDILSFRLFT